MPCLLGPRGEQPQAAGVLCNHVWLETAPPLPDVGTADQTGMFVSCSTAAGLVVCRRWPLLAYHLTVLSVQCGGPCMPVFT